MLDGSYWLVIDQRYILGLPINLEAHQTHLRRLHDYTTTPHPEVAADSTSAPKPDYERRSLRTRS